MIDCIIYSSVTDVCVGQGKTNWVKINDKSYQSDVRQLVHT